MEWFGFEKLRVKLPYPRFGMTTCLSSSLHCSQTSLYFSFWYYSRSVSGSWPLKKHVSVVAIDVCLVLLYRNRLKALFITKVISSDDIIQK